MHALPLILCAVLLKVAISRGQEERSYETTESRRDVTDSSKAISSSKSESSQKSRDYESTMQGYPILYPETHLSSVKRNTSASVANATAVLPPGSTQSDIDDEEAFDDDVIQAGNTTNHGDVSWRCRKPVDLLFLIDSSESVKYSNWKLVIEFVKDLTSKFDLVTTKLGIIRYASDAEVALPLRIFDDETVREKAIDDIFYKTGGTRTDIALKKATEVFHMEQQRSQVLMVVTDGPTNRLEINKNSFVEGKDLVQGPAEELKDAGVAIFAIGIETDSETPDEVNTMKEELRRIASEPTRQHLFVSDGYRELQRKVETISRAACVVNGVWSYWSDFSPCSVTCGYGTKVRMRTCTNPAPENNGADCTGTRVETNECDMGPCSQRGEGGRTSSGKSASNKAGKSSDAAISQVSNSTPAATKQNWSNESESGYESTWSIFHSMASIGKFLSNVTVGQQEHVDDTAGACFEGMQEIPVNDSQFTASSSTSSKKLADADLNADASASNARLNNILHAGAWCAEKKLSQLGNTNQFLQIDLGKRTAVSAVATQGAHSADNWVERYQLRYSDDGISWEYYKNGPLNGNKDRDSIQRHILSPIVIARYFQFNPQVWNEREGDGEICMRVGLFRCRDGPMSKRGRILRERYNHSDHPLSPVTLSSIQYSRLRRHVKPAAGHKRILRRLRKVAKKLVKKISRT